MQTRELSPTSEWSNLDILRSLAVLMVLVDHLLETVGTAAWVQVGYDLGQLGVLLFFVHTSLVLLLSMERSRDGREGTWIASFYVRRAFRIYPLAIAVVLIVSFFRIPRDFGRLPVPISFWTLFGNLTLTQNLAGVDSVIGPLWSLPLEVQMYLLLPFYFVFARKRSAGAVASMGLFFALLSLLFQYASPRVRGLWRLDIINFIPCFMGGILAYSLSRRSKPALPGWAWPPTILASIGSYVVWQRLFPVAGDRHPFYRGWAVCWLIGFAVTRFHDVQTPWVRRICQQIAKYSYGVYLGQVIALWIGFELCASLPAAVQLPLALVLVSLIAVITYHAIENPGIALGKIVARRLRHSSRATLAMAVNRAPDAECGPAD